MRNFLKPGLCLLFSLLLSIAAGELLATQRFRSVDVRRVESNRNFAGQRSSRIVIRERSSFRPQQQIVIRERVQRVQQVHVPVQSFFIQQPQAYFVPAQSFYQSPVVVQQLQVVSDGCQAFFDRY